MLRLLLRLLKIKDFEVCASCATLKEQLEFSREENKHLIETLANIANPKQIVVEGGTTEARPFIPTVGLWSRRRAALEARDREEAKIKKSSPVMGIPDNLKEIEKLEEEMGIPTETQPVEGQTNG